MAMAVAAGPSLLVSLLQVVPHLVMVLFSLIVVVPLSLLVVVPFSLLMFVGLQLYWGLTNACICGR